MITPSQLFVNIPPATKGFTIALVILYLIGLAFPSSVNFFALVPGYTIPPHFYVWNLITSNFFEVSPIQVIINALVLLGIGKYLEPIWGTTEFIKFNLIVATMSGTALFISMIVLFFVTSSTSIWFHPLCGFYAILGGLSVALKQLIPEQEVKLFGVFSLRVNYVPGALILVEFVIFLLMPNEALPYAIFGVFVSWFYLRHYQHRNEVIGDTSDTFSFATFFPDPIRPPIIVISNISDKLLRLFCSCILPSRSSNSYTLASSSDPDTERRKARALRSLEEKMQQIKHTVSTDVITKQDVQEV